MNPKTNHMNALQRKMLAKLTFEPKSIPRNRNFETLAAPEFRRVRKRAAHLRSILEMLAEASADTVSIRRADDSNVEFRLGDVAGGTRISLIPAEEYDMLLQHEQSRELLRGFAAPDVAG